MRKILQQGTKVSIKGRSGTYQVQYDYEDLIYVYGIREPFQPDQITVL